MVKKIKIIYGFIAIAFIFALSLLFFADDPKTPDVKAASTDNVAGFAWSENIGWISFNSINCDSIAPFGQSDGGLGCPIAGTLMSGYGVNLNADDTLSGFAWSENIGWVSFDSSAVAGCPSGTCAPRYVLDSYSGTTSASGGSGNNSGGNGSVIITP